MRLPQARQVWPEFLGTVVALGSLSPPGCACLVIQSRKAQVVCFTVTHQDIFLRPPWIFQNRRLLLTSICCPFVVFIIQYIHIAQIYIYNFIPASTAEWSVGLSFENCQSWKCISCFGGEKSAESLSKFKWSRNSAIPHPRDSTQQDVQPQRNAQNEVSQSQQSQSSIIYDSPVQIAFGLHTSYTAPEHVL